MVYALSINSVKISFDPTPESPTSVTIETPRLRIRSVTSAEQGDYESLFGNRIVMETYATGETKDAAYVQKRIATWIERWKTGDPFSGLAVFKKDTGEFMGHIILGHGDLPGQAELAFLFLPKFWNQGYGKEAVAAILEKYAPELVRLGYQVDGAAFHEVSSTSRVNNIASNRILRRFMQSVGQEEKYGALRNIYKREVEQPGRAARVMDCVRSVFRRVA